jgi:hypothetical protein
VSGELIDCTEDLITQIRSESQPWPDAHPRWFRGEPVVPTGPVPKLYRTQPYPSEGCPSRSAKGEALSAYVHCGRRCRSCILRIPFS